MLENILKIKTKIQDKEAFLKLDLDKFIDYVFDLGLYEEINPKKNNFGRVFKYKPKAEMIIVVPEKDSVNFYNAMRDNFLELELFTNKTQLQIYYDVLTYIQKVEEIAA